MMVDSLRAGIARIIQLVPSAIVLMMLAGTGPAAAQIFSLEFDSGDIYDFFDFTAHDDTFSVEAERDSVSKKTYNIALVPGGGEKCVSWKYGESVELADDDPVHDGTRCASLAISKNTYLLEVSLTTHPADAQCVLWKNDAGDCERLSMKISIVQDGETCEATARIDDHSRMNNGEWEDISEPNVAGGCEIWPD